MPKTNLSLTSPIFNNFLYTIMFQSSLEEKRGLRGKYIQACLNAKKAKKFLETASFEDKQYLLSHFGVEHFIVFVKKESVNFKKLLEILKQYEMDQEIKSMDDLADLKLFVSGDKQFNHLLGLMASSIHHSAFFLNLEMKRLSYNISKFPKNLFTKGDLDMREGMDNARTIMKTLLNGIMQLSYSQGSAGITEDSMKILIYLYIRHTNYVTRLDMKTFFAGQIKEAKITASLKSLMKLMYVNQDIDKTDPKFTISGHGMKVASEYLQAVLKLNTY